MITFKAKDSDADLMIFGDIGESYFGESVTAKQFAEDLKNVGDVKNLNIYINSGGGNVFDAQAIYSMLKRHNASKTVYIEGIAASAASVIAMVGDKIIMPSNALMMIHRAWTVASGNVHDFERIVNTIQQVDSSIAETYVDKTGIDKFLILEMMDKETWLTADEAKEKGFADKIEKEKKVAASVQGDFFMLNGQQFDKSKFINPPEIEEFIVENRGESQPVSNRSKFQNIRKKINEIF